MTPRAARTLVAALLAATVTTPATARNDFATAKDLKGWLQEAERNGGSFRDTTMALGYVGGVHDLLADTEVCAPKGVTARALLRAVHGWMKTHPDDWADGAADTIRRALTDLHPCPPKS
ncbi:MAG: hypothetical protein MUF30_09995 [Burkholderiales bacterium]|jgi:hypothetical protein|nr:hypothetical protein [Burkholderiales bacterium]